LQKVTVNSFHREFVVGKGGFGKVWKVIEKGSRKVYAMKEMQKVKIISKRSVHSVMN
jgi:serine/threonine protein kinase